MSALNAEQRRAVEHGGGGMAGPLAVLAGPGAGKTRVIIERIAHLIGERGVRPESIVAVTFTVKAAGQLRERLLERVGGSAAQRVYAGTFHALALSVLRRFPDLLGLGGAGPGGGLGLGSAALLDSVQRKRLLRGVILERGLFDGARGAGLEVLTEQVGRVEAWLGTLGIDREGRGEILQRVRDGLAAGRDERGECLESEALEAAEERCARLAQIFAALDGFEEARWSRGLLSFDDLIVQAARVARAPAAARILRDDWRHFVVDEWQDVNAAQVRFLSALAPPPGLPGAARPADRSWPDLCVVGDDDQAIFGFRGADTRAFETFERLWGPDPGTDRGDNRRVPVVRLEINYRSRPGIIAAGNFQLSRLSSRFDPGKRIAASAGAVERESREGAELGPAVECIEHGAGMEGGVIAALLLADQARRGRPEGDQAPLAWSDYAVLVRHNSTAEKIAGVLRLEGIPARTEQAGSPLADDGVQDVLAWADLLVEPAGPGAVLPGVRLLTRPPIGVPGERALEWGRIYAAELEALEEKARPRSRDGVSGRAERPTFLDCCRRLAEGMPEAAALARFEELYGVLAAGAAHEPAAAAIERIVREADAAHAEPLPARARAARVGCLVALVRVARQVQPLLGTNQGGVVGLRAMRRYLDELGPDDPLLKGAGADEVFGDGGNGDERGEDQTGECVAVITAHKAKGLEWRTVFVARAQPKHGFGGAQARSLDEIITPALERIAGEVAGVRPAATGTDRPDDPYPGLLPDPDADEERRLFYVVQTRARERLIVLAERFKSKSAKGRYLEEMVEGLCKPWENEPFGTPPAAVARSIEDVRRACIEAGVAEDRLRPLLTGSGEVDEPNTGALGAGLTRERVCGLERALARRAAAEAVDRVLLPDVHAAEVAAAAGRAATAVRRAAVVAHLQRRGELPGWLTEEDDGLREFGARLLGQAEGGHLERPASGGPGERDGPRVAPPRPPLLLSYTMIEQYIRCPACYCVKYLLGLPEPPTSRLVLGVAAHRALERYAREVREADAESRGGGVGLDRLLALGRGALAEQAGGLEADERQAVAEQLLDQLRLVHARLHGAESEILEVEWSKAFDYPLPDPRDAAVTHAHRITAKIDRIDRVGAADKDGERQPGMQESGGGGGGIRIIDYKTGGAKSNLLEPKKDDLQLGIYAMAAERAFGPESVWESGEAEYWVLSTGERGRVALRTLDRVKIERQVREAVDGMLLGRFDRKKGCEGVCWVLG